MSTFSNRSLVLALFGSFCLAFSSGCGDPSSDSRVIEQPVDVQDRMEAYEKEMEASATEDR